MDTKSDSPYFKYSPDVIESIRKEYDLDKPGRIEEAVKILDDWIQKQDHIIKKDFSEYQKFFFTFDLKDKLQVFKIFDKRFDGKRNEIV